MDGPSREGGKTFISILKIMIKGFSFCPKRPLSRVVVQDLCTHEVINNMATIFLLLQKLLSFITGR